ncbi:MAG TPA: hypothetical protein VGH28_24020 [Polyangiaceae bacterium]|jgi:hypothetical protein
MAARSTVPLLSPSASSGRALRVYGTENGTVRYRSYARPMGAVAIRVPERAPHAVFPRFSPRLFVHEGARQSLERKLSVGWTRPVVLSITDNRHAMISHSEERGVVKARVHHMFLDAPPRVQDALVRYVREGDREASDLIGRYIESNTPRLARVSRHKRLVTQGHHHDLLATFQRLNDKYFGGTMNVLVTWGARQGPPKSPRATIKLGSYAFQDRLVRIHPALDRRWVPRYFLEYVMFHEMLHHAMPATRGPGRRLLHPPEFREREHEFRNYERALAWERAHLHRLLRA